MGDTKLIPGSSSVVIAMLDRAGIGPDDSVIDVGGSSSPLAGALLEREHSDLTVLDVSRVGLRAAQQRLRAAADKVQWLVGDVRTWRPSRPYAVWHDRALFHFMSTDQDRDAYLRTVDEATSTERAVVTVATSVPDGPLRCSGFKLPATAPLILRPPWQMINESRELHSQPTLSPLRRYGVLPPEVGMSNHGVISDHEVVALCSSRHW